MPADANSQSSAAQARRLEAVYEQLSALLQRPDVAARLRTAPGEQEWSALEIVGHTVEMIPYWLDKCQMMIAAEEPPQFGRTPDAPERLAGVALGSTRNASELVSQLKQVVVMATEQIAGMSEAERSKTGVHSTRGALTVAELIESMVVGHAEAHLAQVQAALQGSAN